VVAAVLVQLERHDRHPGRGKGRSPYATQLLTTNQPIRAPRSRTLNPRKSIDTISRFCTKKIRVPAANRTTIAI
jgi:hypothetical protein